MSLPSGVEVSSFCILILVDEHTMLPWKSEIQIPSHIVSDLHEAVLISAIILMILLRLKIIPCCLLDLPTRLLHAQYVGSESGKVN